MEIENNFEALLDEVSFNEESAASNSDYHSEYRQCEQKIKVLYNAEINALNGQTKMCCIHFYYTRADQQSLRLIFSCSFRDSFLSVT